MTLGFFGYLQNVWPFSIRKFDDLRVSKDIVHKLSVPQHTKEFVYAVRDPETRSVIYILSAQSLSERSASDAECLIREVKPDAVVVQVGFSPVTENEVEGNELGNSVDNPFPTSSFEVLLRCFVDKVTKDKYENVAGNLVLQEIFGISFHGHFLAAKKAAEEVGSSLLAIESPFVNSSGGNDVSSEGEAVSKFQGLVSSLAPKKVGSAIPLSSKRIFLTNDIQSQMIKILSAYMDLSSMGFNPLSSLSEIGSQEIQPRNDYEVPPFAEPIYSLLVDLHNIYINIPTIGRALAHSQKMLDDLNRGESVDIQTVSEVYTFRVAVEGLRIALNNAGRLPINKIVNSNSAINEFSELPVEEKSQVLLAQALQSQAKKFKTIVAVVDASCLVGLRKYWNYSVPPEVTDLVEQIVTETGDGKMNKQSDRWQLLTGKPVVAVGAGATAVVGVSSLSKVVPLSTFMKVVTFKVPASLKLIITQTYKAVALASSKILGPSKVVARGFASSGFKTTSIMNATASAEKIRAVAHGVIASAEKTSISAMRTAFYEIMRKRHMIRPIGFLPWATFGCSVATCTGLLVYGDGIECAAESLPAAPSIASLGRGIQRLQQVSQEVRQTDGTRIQKSIESLMCRLKKVKVQ